MSFDDGIGAAMEFVIMKICAPLLLVGLILAITFLPYAMYQDRQRPTFELKKDAWECTQSHTETHCFKGCYKTIVCDQWSAK